MFQKNVLLASLIILLISCNSVKKTQKAINSGDYDNAINKAVKKLRKDKMKEKNEPFILMLEDSYKKATKRDVSKINFLKKENTINSLEKVYRQYLILEKRQQKIKPLLPLVVNSKNKEATFKFFDYSDAIIASKTKLTDRLYINAEESLKAAVTKVQFRNVYKAFQYINRLTPNYKEVVAYSDLAYSKGIDYVLVSLKNDTEQIIPKRLEEDLLNFNTYKLNDFWTLYHNQKNNDIHYDFDLVLSFRSILISPERIREKEMIQERQVVDGKELLLDENGNSVKDSNGNVIKVDKMKTVVCQLYQFTQIKSVTIDAQANYIDHLNNQMIKTHPIVSEFVFEHSYANYKGDKRAIQDTYLNLISSKEIPFPSNEQMVYDTGEDLKRKLKTILKRNRFRN